MYTDRLSESQLTAIEKACAALGDKAAFTSRTMLAVMNELRRLQLEVKQMKRWTESERETLN